MRCWRDMISAKRKPSLVGNALTATTTIWFAMARRRASVATFFTAWSGIWPTKAGTLIKSLTN